MTDNNKEKDTKLEKKGEAEEDKEEVLEPEELKNLSPDIKKIFRFVSMQMRSSVGISPPRELLEKIDKEHISKALELSDKDDERQYKYATAGRKYTLTYVILAIVAFFGLVFILLNKDIELLKEVIKTLLIFAAGLGAGFGLKSYKDQKSHK